MFTTAQINELQEMLPFLIPIIILEMGLFVVTLHHILTHDKYKRGNRVIWLVIAIVGMNFVGPILYWALGKSDEEN